MAWRMQQGWHAETLLIDNPKNEATWILQMEGSETNFLKYVPASGGGDFSVGVGDFSVGARTRASPSGLPALLVLRPVP